MVEEARGRKGEGREGWLRRLFSDSLPTGYAGGDSGTFT